MFYDNLKAICKAKKTSPSAVALAVGISKSNVTRWKSGQTPKMENIASMAEYLNVNIYDLIDKEKPAIKDDELSKDELEFLTMYRRLSPEQKKVIDDLARVLDSEK